jgi:hypothetical protein
LKNAIVKAHRLAVHFADAFQLQGADRFIELDHDEGLIQRYAAGAQRRANPPGTSNATAERRKE